jgi:ATP-grasp domain, R2K clade family 3
MLLVPADALTPRRPDEHFAGEADAARAAGLDVVLVDHDALTVGGDVRPAVARIPQSPAGAVAIYRGWMMTSGQYAMFADALTARNTMLRTSPAQYRLAQELPGWYPALADVTPRSMWTAGDDRDGFERARRDLGGGPAVLRDYVKSMKHYWHEAAFIPDLGDAAAAWAVASRFRQQRDDDFAVGFVLRRFEPFVSAEVRTWWVDGACQLVGPHPDTPHDPPPTDLDPSTIAPLIAGLRLPFVTVDLARRTDGVWRVVELGDGQVSDRPSTITPDDLIAALTNRP